MATAAESHSIKNQPSPSSSKTAGNGLVQTPSTPYRFTVDEYLKMSETGVLPKDSKVELIDGVIYPMSPSSEEHSFGIVSILNVFRRLPEEYTIFSQIPVRFPGSLPEPDFGVVHSSVDTFRKRYVQPSDILLLVEVSKSSASFDRTQKLALYAETGIPEYWIVDIDNKQIEVFSDPKPAATPPAFLQSTVVSHDGTATFSPAEGISVDVKVRDIIE